MTDPTLEQRATNVLAALTATAPTPDEVVAGIPLPEWMGASWLPHLTDPTDSRFAASIVKAEAWLETH